MINWFGEVTAIDSLCHYTNSHGYGDSTVTVYVGGVESTKCKVEFINNSPFISIDCNIEARVQAVSGNSKSLDNSNIETIEKEINLYLKNKLYDYLYKTSLEFNSDCCGFGKYAITNFLLAKDWNNYNWMNNYRNSIFKVNVNSSLKSGLLLTQD